MANRAWKPQVGTLTDGLVTLTGYFTTTTSGTIGTQDCEGFTVTNTATKTRRYTITLADAYVAFRGAQITVEGAADAAYTSDKGVIPFVRGVAVSSKVLYIQFAKPSVAATATQSGSTIAITDGAITVTETGVDAVTHNHTAPTTATQAGSTGAITDGAITVTTGATSYADADLENAAKVYITLTLKNSSL